MKNCWKTSEYKDQPLLRGGGNEVGQDDGDDGDVTLKKSCSSSSSSPRLSSTGRARSDGNQSLFIKDGFDDVAMILEVDPAVETVADIKTRIAAGICAFKFTATNKACSSS